MSPLGMAVTLELAAPFVVLARARPGIGALAGMLYGSATWAFVNGTILPLAFGRAQRAGARHRTDLTEPAVHVLYGLAVSGDGSWRHRMSVPQSVRFFEGSRRLCGRSWRLRVAWPHLAPVWDRPGSCSWVRSSSPRSEEPTWRCRIGSSRP